MFTTRRIQPADLSTAPHKDLIEQLALRWVVADLPAPISYRYLDYLQAIGTLLLTTQDADQTRLIFTAVLNQAVALDRSSLWVEDELKFEGMMDGADRVDFLNFELSQVPHVDDELLDQYNQRLHRFTPATHEP